MMATPAAHLPRFAPRTFSGAGFLTAVVVLQGCLTWLAAGVLYLTVTNSLIDPAGPWEFAGQVVFWWPLLLLRNGVAFPLAALWWLVLAWSLALAVDRTRARLWTAA